MRVVNNLLSKKIRICVVGTGRMGYFHTRLLNRLHFLDSIVDSNPKVAEKIGNQFGRPWFTNLDSMIEERSPNGIIIAVPTNYHSEVTVKALDLVPELKALLIEKPVTPSVEEAIKLRSILMKQHVPVIVGHIEVFNPLISRIIQMLNDGFIGEIRSILFQRRGAVGEGRIKTLGDVYIDVGVHDFDIASRILPQGEIKLFTSSVKTKGVDNSSVTVISSAKNNFYGTFLMSREYAGKIRTIDIEGTKATLHANLITQIIELRSLEIAKGEKKFSAIRVPFSSGEQIKVYGEPLLHEIWNLVDCINETEKPLVSIDDAIRSLKIVEAARKSISTKESVILNLD